MLVLGIAGSPRRHGNSELLLDAALEGARREDNSIEKIILADLKIAPCRGCDCCRYGSCTIRDDMEYILLRLEQAGAIIIASPIYFYGLTSQLKTLIDRCQIFWNRYYKLKQPLVRETGQGRGALISVGATRGEQLFLGAILTTRYFFKALNMEYKHELLVRGVDDFGAIREHPEKLEAAYRLGQNLVAQARP